jgi:hypothetical protein
MSDSEKRPERRAAPAADEHREGPGQPITRPRANPEVDEEKLRLAREEMERVTGN